MGTWIKTERGRYYEPSNEELIVDVAVMFGADIGIGRADALEDIERASRDPIAWGERYAQLILENEPGEREELHREYIKAVLDAAENGQITWWNAKKRGDNDEQAHEQHFADVAF